MGARELESPTISARRAQAFPTLTPAEFERLARFGTPCEFADGAYLYESGKRSPGMFVVLSGTVRVTARDAHGHPFVIIELGPGAFTGELGQLSGRRSYVDGVAVGPVRATLIPPERIRAVLIAEAVLGEKIMRALILRRVGLIESGAGGPMIVGDPASHDVARLRNFLTRNGIPHAVLDPATEDEARLVVDRYTPAPTELPLVLCMDGSILRNPPETKLARCIGMLEADAHDRVYDVGIVGAGPAGLAAAVYAASEGLSVTVFDARAFGGQAGASARIENYLGFPTGISGLALAGRAYTQAQKFGARMEIPEEVTAIDCDRSADADAVTLTLGSGGTVRCRTVVIASGARYRRADSEALRALEGHGVWFWASPVEARLCAGQDVVVVGGGNSAGQAAVYLAEFAGKVYMLVRGPGLAESMSRYLIDRIAATPNIQLLTRTKIVGAEGSLDTGLQSVTWRDLQTGRETTQPTQNVFLFLGAEPRTEWLRGCDVALDGHGFVLTGSGRLQLETSVPGIFAIGDVRAGSVKRVGGAIGEGAAVVAQIHAFLASRPSLQTH